MTKHAIPKQENKIATMKMRTLVKFILATLILSGCDQNSKPSEQGLEEASKIAPEKTAEKAVAKPAVGIQGESIRIEQLGELVPIDTVDSRSNDVFKKYGLEMNGNCYTCDLAILSLTEKSIALTNVCDSKTVDKHNIVEFSAVDDRIEIKTRQNDFIFTKIDQAPVYELKITGTGIKNKNLRISKYYTLKKILNKFEQHDCGDFQG